MARHGLPVYPGALPVAGHLLALRHRALQMLEDGLQRFGGPFWINMGFGQWMLFCLGPESLALWKNEVTTTEQGAYDIFGKGIGRSMIASDGAAHRHVRSAMQPTFTPSHLAASHASRWMAETLSHRVAAMAEAGEARILNETLDMTLEVALRITGVATHDLAVWKKNYRKFVLLAVPVKINLPGFPRWIGEQGMAWLDAKIAELVRQTRASGQPPETSLMHSLVAARDEEGAPLTDREIVDNLRVLFAAGHETTSSLLAWLAIVVARDRELWEKLRAEILGAGTAPADLTIEIGKKLPLANAIFRETVRFYSPSWYNPRKSVCAFKFANVEIPAGLHLALSPAHSARNKERYGDPNVFRIERWLERKEPLNAADLIPFGGGPHFCIGYHLAWQESLQFLATLAAELEKRRLYPALAPGCAARPCYVPFGHPESSTRLRFLPR